MYKAVKKSNRFIGLIVCLCLGLVCLCGGFAGVYFARAEEQTPQPDANTNIKTTVVKSATACTYYYFDFPSAIFAEDSVFRVVDGATVHVFSTVTEADKTVAKETGTATLPNAYPEKLVMHGDPLTLYNGTIYKGNTALGSEHTFTDFTVANSTLYAVDQNTVYTYDLSDNTQIATQADESDVESGNENNGDDGNEENNNENGEEGGETPTDPVETPDPIDPAPTQTFVATSITFDSRIDGIAYSGDSLYIAVTNKYNRYLRDIVRYDINTLNGAGTTVLTLSQDILQMDGYNGGIVCLTRDAITVYSLAGNHLTATSAAACSDAVAISVSGDYIYGITQAKSVFKWSTTLSASREELLASAFTESGFFYAPAGIATRQQQLLVADEHNDRVQILHDGGVTVLPDIPRPKAAVTDYLGNIYVANSGSKITVFDASTYNAVKTYDAPDTNIVLTDLQIDSGNNLYALANSGQVYYIKAGDTALDTTDLPSNVIAMTMAQSEDALYVATTDKKILKVFHNDIRDIDDVDGSVSHEFSKYKMLSGYDYAVVALCTDHSDSLYLLTQEGDIVKFARTTDNTIPYTLHSETAFPLENGRGFVNATRIFMNTTDDLPLYADSNEKVTLTYGDLLICDTGAHAVKRIDGEALEVNRGYIDDVPKDTIDDEHIKEDKTQSILFPVAACKVYKTDSERYYVTELRAGTKVIIPNYDANAKFNFIIADDIAHPEANEPIYGYIYTSLIGNAIPYAEPPAQQCFSVLPNITVYKYPTQNGPVLPLTFDGQKAVSFDLLPFAQTTINTRTVYGYSDNFALANNWYRVSYTADDGVTHEGYVKTDSIAFGIENPDDRTVYPRYNASITSTIAHLYTKDENGEMQIINDSYLILHKNDRVEVLGTFDSTEKYTRICYYRDNLGTVTYYVETTNIDYDGINRVNVVAVIVIIVTVLLCAGLIIGFIWVKRNKRMNVTKL